MLKTIKQKYSGFTLIEMIIVLSIIVLISGALYANYREINDQGRIAAVADKIKGDLNLAQSYALAGRSAGANEANGWGVYFDRNLNKYIIYADLNNNGMYDYPTKLLIHGTEAYTPPYFNESSNSAKQIQVQDGANKVSSAGMPADNTGYWNFPSAGSALQTTAYSSDFNFGTDNFAVDLWFRKTSTGSKKALVYKGYGGAPGTASFALYKDTDGAHDIIRIDILGDDSATYTATSTYARTPLSDNTWYHVAVAKERNILKLFINGAVQQSVAMTAGVKNNGSDEIFIGADDTLSKSWDGDIDEVRITKGNGRWFELFNTPTAGYKSSDELYREVKLPPGLAFDYLYEGSTPISAMNVFFNPTNYFMYVNNNAATESATITINSAGVTNGTSGSIPKSIRIDNSGAVNWN